MWKIKKIDKPTQMVWSQFSIKIIGVYFGNSAHEKGTGTKYMTI